MRFLLMLALLCCAPTSQPRDAEAILAEYDATVEPIYDYTRIEDDAYGERFSAERSAAQDRRAELARALWQIAPTHPRAVALLGERWRILVLTTRGKEALAEANAALAARAAQAAHRGDALTNDLLIARATMSGLYCLVYPQEHPVEELSRNIDACLQACPNDERIATPMMELAKRTKAREKQIAIYRQIARDYPKSKEAPLAEGCVRNLEGVGQPFEFSFTDAISGKPISSADYRGKILIVDFWATWCGPCREKLPELKEIYAKHKADGVEVIGISLDMPEEQGGLRTLRKFVADHELPWPQWYQGKGWDSEFSRSWGVEAIPTVFIVDRDGRLHSTNANPATAIEKLLQAPTTRPTTRR